MHWHLVRCGVEYKCKRKEAKRSETALGKGICIRKNGGTKGEEEKTKASFAEAVKTMLPAMPPTCANYTRVEIEYLGKKIFSVLFILWRVGESKGDP